jgi:hypothetical protein
LCRKYNDLLYLQMHISTFKLSFHPLVLNEMKNTQATLQVNV